MPFMRMNKNINAIDKYALERYFQRYCLHGISIYFSLTETSNESNRKAMNRNWGNQKANPALKTKTGNK